VIRMGVADPEQLVVGGWSYGGFFTNWAITQTVWFKAAVSGAGVSNWVSFAGTCDVRSIFEVYFAAPVEEFPDEAWKRSPLRYLSKANTPTLIVHGEADFRVPIGQSYELYEGLKSNGVETVLAVYPREPHTLTERKHQIDLLERVVAWYDDHLGRADSQEPAKRAAVHSTVS
jgi:dipeptidyl aminopeptidase/acylaminoacyl peptidase